MHNKHGISMVLNSNYTEKDTMKSISSYSLLSGYPIFQRFLLSPVSHDSSNDIAHIDEYWYMFF